MQFKGSFCFPYSEIRLVLMGNESRLQNVVHYITRSLEGAELVQTVGVDMEDEREGGFEEAVEKACQILGNLDAFVHCYSYEGTPYVTSL